MIIVGPVMLVPRFRRSSGKPVRRITVNHHTPRRCIVQIPAPRALHLERFQQLDPAMLPQQSMSWQPTMPPVDDFLCHLAHDQTATGRDRPSQRAVPGERNHKHIMRRHMIHQLLHNPRACLTAKVRFFPLCCLGFHPSSVAGNRVTVKPTARQPINTPPLSSFAKKKSCRGGGIRVFELPGFSPPTRNSMNSPESLGTPDVGRGRWRGWQWRAKHNMRAVIYWRAATGACHIRHRTFVGAFAVTAEVTWEI